MKTPEEEAKEIMENIFKLQHVDDRAKMICLSTKTIAIFHVDGMINLAKRIFHNYGLGYMGTTTSRNDFTKTLWYKHYQSIRQAIEKM